jgi:hypothetical protein
MRLATLAVILLIGCTHRAETPANAPLDPSLTQLSFILGNYSNEKDGVVTSERWFAPGGKVMLGVGSTVKNGQTVFFEYLRIESREDGIYYIAQPRGNPPTPFKLVESTATQVKFENPNNDFPSRIIYERVDAKTIRARIEGMRKGAPAFEEWIYIR